MEKKKKVSKSIADKVKSLDININEFGEITQNLQIDEINKFLNKTVDDKKLRDRTFEEE